MGTGALSLGVKWRGREADHSPPASAEVKKMWIHPLPHMPSYGSAKLVKHRDNFYRYYFRHILTLLVMDCTVHSANLLCNVYLTQSQNRTEYTTSWLFKTSRTSSFGSQTEKKLRFVFRLFAIIIGIIAIIAIQRVQRRGVQLVQRSRGPELWVQLS
jgi:hypothetical protein